MIHKSNMMPVLGECKCQVIIYDRATDIYCMKPFWIDHVCNHTDIPYRISFMNAPRICIFKVYI